jgi:hypothetical protein
LLVIGVYGFIYVGMTLFSMSFIDASTVLDTRLMLPVYLVGWILVMAGFAWLYSKKHIAWKIATVFVLLVCLAMTFNDGKARVVELSRDGLGFDSIGTKMSPTISYIEQMQPIIIYTNKAYMVYIVTGRLAYMVTGPVDPVTLLPRAEDAAEYEKMRASVMAEDAVLIYFKDEGYATDPWFLMLTRGLSPIEEYSDGIIFKGVD